MYFGWSFNSKCGCWAVCLNPAYHVTSLLINTCAFYDIFDVYLSLSVVKLYQMTWFGPLDATLDQPCWYLSYFDVHGAASNSPLTSSLNTRQLPPLVSTYNMRGEGLSVHVLQLHPDLINTPDARGMNTSSAERGQGSLSYIFLASVRGLVQLSVDYKSVYICGVWSLLLVLKNSFLVSPLPFYIYSQNRSHIKYKYIYFCIF